jgi:histone H3/H4
MSDDEDVKSLDTRAPGDHDGDAEDDAKTNKKAGAETEGAGAVTNTKKKKSDAKGGDSRRKQLKPKKRSQLKPAASADGEARKRRYKPGTVALRQIRKYQKSTDNLLPRATFKRLVKSITDELTAENTYFDGGVRFKSEAVDALQAATEDELVTLFNLANAINIDIGRSITLGRDGNKAFRLAYNMRHADFRLGGGLSATEHNPRSGSLLP